jgi:hypothetical protein
LLFELHDFSVHHFGHVSSALPIDESPNVVESGIERPLRNVFDVGEGHGVFEDYDNFGVGGGGEAHFAQFVIQFGGAELVTTLFEQGDTVDSPGKDNDLLFNFARVLFLGSCLTIEIRTQRESR